MLLREEAEMPYFKPYGLARLIVTTLAAAAVLCSGVRGSGCCGRAPLWIAWTSLKNTNVFAAAPLRVRRVVPENEQLTKLYVPPPYSNVASLNMQSRHSMPSSCWVSDFNRTRSKRAKSDGTTGMAAGSATPAWAKAKCATVDVWLPESMRNIEKAPALNDPNASITLDITPAPHNGAGCAVWRYHYGPPPARGGHSTHGDRKRQPTGRHVLQ